MQIKKLLILTSAFMTALTCQAQWQAIGPYGGHITCISSNDSMAFIGTNGDGVFKYDSNDENWTPVNNGLPPNLRVGCMAMRGSNVFIGTQHGIFLSPDYGTSWVPVNNGLDTTIGIATFIVATDSAVFVFIATTVSGGGYKGGNYSSFDGTSYWSTDNGNHWVGSDNSLSGLTTVAVNGPDILAGTGNGVYLSKDNGNNWIAEDTGFSEYVGAIVVKDSSIFAGTFSNGIFFSADYGNSWSQVNPGFTDTAIYSLTFSDTTIFAATGLGIFLSADNGKNWLTANNTYTPQGTLALAVSGSEVFAACSPLSSPGVVLSNDNGNSWSVVNNGITNTNISSLATGTSALFAMTGDHLFSTNRDNVSWSPVSLFSNDLSDYVLNVGAEIFVSNYDTIYSSSNDGSNWSILNTPPDFTYLASNNSSIAGYDGNTNNIYLSTDNGVTWKEIYSGLAAVGYVSSAAMNDSTIFIGSSYEEGDCGGVLFPGGLYILHNGGNQWSVVDSSFIGETITTLVANGPHIYLNGSDLLLSTDNGVSWSTLNGLPTNATISALAVSGSNIFVGMNNYNAEYGIYYSQNNGDTWAGFDSGLTCNLINSLVISGSTLYAGTSCGGIWQRSISSITGIPQISMSTPEFDLFPNPATNNFFIETSVTGPKQLQIFDLTGQIILSRAVFNSINNIDASGIVPGVYLIRLETSDGIVTKKLVVE